jgi:hypothetical protein
MTGTQPASTSGRAEDLSAEQLPRAWKVLASVAGGLVEDQFTQVAYVDNEGTDTQVGAGG